jgi:trimeric autotransporter adhesin
VKHLKKHLSFANVVACIALFVALGGSAVAVTAMLPKKSVKTRHLAQGVVTTTKLRNGAVTAAKIRNGAVTAAKIGAGAVGSTQLADGGIRSADLGGGVVTFTKLKNGAVTSDKLAAGAVTASKIADGAVTAAKLAPTFSAQLVKDVSYVIKASATDSEQEKTAKAECPAGKAVIGGGAKAGPAEAVAVTESAPVVDTAGNRVAWSATAREIVADAASWSVEAYAICAEI